MAGTRVVATLEWALEEMEEGGGVLGWWWRQGRVGDGRGRRSGRKHDGVAPFPCPCPTVARFFTRAHIQRPVRKGRVASLAPPRSLPPTSLAPPSLPLVLLAHVVVAVPIDLGALT